MRLKFSCVEAHSIWTFIFLALPLLPPFCSDRLPNTPEIQIFSDVELANLSWPDHGLPLWQQLEQLSKQTAQAGTRLGTLARADALPIQPESNLRRRTWWDDPHFRESVYLVHSLVRFMRQPNLDGATRVIDWGVLESRLVAVATMQ